MKDCTVCGQRKDLQEFYYCPSSRDQRYGKCKECWKAASHRNYVSNLEARRARQRQYQRTPEGKETSANSRKAYRKRYPEKRIAHALVNRAVLCGRLHKQPCEMCGSAVSVEAHHPDYSKPLDVRWLCRPCHQAIEGRRVDTDLIDYTDDRRN